MLEHILTSILIWTQMPTLLVEVTPYFPQRLDLDREQPKILDLIQQKQILLDHKLVPLKADLILGAIQQMVFQAGGPILARLPNFILGLAQDNQLLALSNGEGRCQEQLLVLKIYQHQKLKLGQWGLIVV